MTEYEYVMASFDEDGRVDIPPDAVGITLDTMGDFEGGIRVFARYLIPVEDSHD